MDESLQLDDKNGDEYRLILEVLEGDWSPSRVQIPGKCGLISRGRAKQIHLSNAMISTPHTALDISHLYGQKDRIRDLSSKNGTFQNGVRLQPNQWQPLNDGDSLQFGLTVMRYDRTNCQLIYEKGSDRPLSLLGSDRWLICGSDEVPLFPLERSNDPAVSIPHVYLGEIDGLIEVRDLSSNGRVYVPGLKKDRRLFVFNETTLQIGRETKLRISVDAHHGGIPLEIGPWQRQAWIATGGMALIYRVRHKQTGQTCAMKILLPSKRQNKEFLLKERDLAEQIHDSNLPEVHDYGEIDDLGLPYLVFDYIDGPSLASIIKILGELDVANIAEIVAQVSHALDMVHMLDHIHCDVRPGNIMISHAGHVYLIDLGVSTQTGQKYSGHGVDHYLPDEIKYDLKPVDRDTDIYSLGRTMWSMLKGELLFYESTGEEPNLTQVEPPQKNTVLSGSPNLRPTTSGRSVSMSVDELERIITKCTRDKRRARYQKISELLADLDPLRVGSDLKTLVANAGWRSLLDKYPQ